jgi:hypothetical protein
MSKKQVQKSALFPAIESKGFYGTQHTARIIHSRNEKVERIIKKTKF